LTVPRLGSTPIAVTGLPLTLLFLGISDGGDV